MDRTTPGRGGAEPVVLAVRRGASTAGGWTTGPGGLERILNEALSAAGLDTLLSEPAVPRAADSDPDPARQLEGVVPAVGPRKPTSVALLVGLGAVAFTAPDLVRGIADRLATAGLEVRLLAAVPSRDRDLGWLPATLAVRHGLPADAVADPFDDLRTSGFPPAALHHDQPVSRIWLEADLRIVVAPCATDAGQGLSAVLAALAGLAPRIPGADPAEAVADLAAHAAPDFAILDATVVSHGAFGTAVRRELPAGTVVASRSAVLVDVAAGALLGLDPGASSVVAACLGTVGLPPGHVVDGDLTVLSGVQVPTLPLIRSLPESGGSAGLARVMAAALAVDADGAPPPGPEGPDEPPLVVLGPEPELGDPVLDALRAVLGPWAMAGGESPAAASVLAGVQGVAAATAQAVAAWRTTFAKDRIERVETGLGLDLAAFRAADYEAVPDLLGPLVDQASALPDTGDPLKWQHLDGSVLFEVTRTVQADYGAWVQRVDISQAIRLMADYLGGRRVVVARDRSERPVRQAERNLYLPQPNYVAFTGGQVIDVCKLEVIRYHRDSQEIWWQTVRSPNGSADYDDGTVEFADVGPGLTRIRIRGRQRFTLPLFWQVVDIDRFPGLREVLTTDAYRRFFTSTLDNFEACFEGRPFEIGRPAADRGLATRDLTVLLALAREGATQWLAERRDDFPGESSRPADRSGQGWLDLAVDVARDWFDAARPSGASDRPRPAPRRAPDVVDEDGFWHFRGEQG